MLQTEAICTKLMHVLVVLIQLLIAGGGFPIRYVQLALDVYQAVTCSSKSSRMMDAELTGVDLGDVLNDPLR